MAQEYGPDAVITPSLWGYEIIDALLVREYPKISLIEESESMGLGKETTLLDTIS